MKKKLKYEKNYFVNMVERHGRITMFSQNAINGIVTVIFENEMEMELEGEEVNTEGLKWLTLGEDWWENPYL